MTQYEMTYTTPDLVAEYLRVADPNAVPSSPEQSSYAEFFTDVTDTIWQASAIIDELTNNKFMAYYDTRKYYLDDIYRYSQIRQTELRLDDYLLSVSSISWAGSAVSSSSYILNPPNLGSKLTIRFDDNAITTGAGINFDDSVDVTGIWGYHTIYNNAWVSTTTLSANVSSTTTTSISVTSASAFQNLHYVKINDEFMQVTAVDTDTNTLTVERGVNGSTATTHTSADAVSIFVPIRDIRMACNRLAGWLYQHRGDVADRIQLADGTQLISELPRIVTRAVSVHRKPIYYVV